MYDTDHTISAARKELIKTSWEMVVPIASQAADIFYEKLFASNPAIKTLFAGTVMSEQKHKLVHALSAVVGAIDTIHPSDIKSV